MSKSAFVLGYIGPKCTSNIRKDWNAFLVSQESGGMFDFYRTTTTTEAELRLSEMFVLQRRGYIVDKKFAETILPLLDAVDVSAKKAGKVDSVLNKAGVLVGYYFGCDPNDLKNERLKLWFEPDAVKAYTS